MSSVSTFFQNIPLNRGIHATVQTASFVHAENEESYQEMSKQKVRETKFFPQNFTASDNSWKLLDEFKQSYADYYALCAEHKKVHDLLPFAAIGAGSMKNKKWSTLIQGGLAVYDWCSSYQISKYQKIVEKYAFELAPRLEISDADLITLQNLSPEEREAQINGYLNNDPFWQSVAHAEWMPPNVQAEIARVLSLNWSKVSSLNSPTMTDEQLRQELPNAVQALQCLYNIPAQFQKDLNKCTESLNACQDDWDYMKRRLTSIDKTSKEGLQLMRFMADMQYKNLTTAEKIEGINRGIYPQHIGDRETLEILSRWEKAGNDLLAITRPVLMLSQVARQLGIPLPKDFEKIPLGAEKTFQVLMGIGTANPLMLIDGILGLVGLFKGSGPDMNALYHEQVMEALSAIYGNQEIMMSMIQDLQRLVEEVYRLCLQTHENLRQIAVFVVQAHLDTMAELHKIHEDVLYQHQLIFQIHIDQHTVNFNELKQLMSERDYECESGIFKTHQVAQRFFREQWQKYDQAMEAANTLFSVNNNAINSFIKYQGLYSQDEQHFPEQHRHFFEDIWGSAYRYYNRLEPTEKERLFPTLFDPVSHVSALDAAVAGGVEVGSKIDLFLCGHFFNTLVAPHMVLTFGNHIADFHRYDPLIKNFNTGELYSIDELIREQHMGVPQKRGKKLLAKVLNLTNLAIAQHTLLSGGTLIPKFYNEFFENLADYTARLRNPETPEREKNELIARLQIHVDLLAKNPLFAKNALLYAIRKKLALDNQEVEKEKKCFDYRMAYNYSIDSTKLRELFPGWEFTSHLDEEDKQSWQLVCPFPLSNELGEMAPPEELKIPLIDPSDLYHGRMFYPMDLLQLVDLRNRIIDELVSYDLPAKLEGKPVLKKTLADKIILSV